MTTQQKLEKLKEKIIEAVPEIMELKFGCEVEIKRNYIGKDWKIKNIISSDKKIPPRINRKLNRDNIGYYNITSYWTTINGNYMCINEKIYEEKIIKILGRPIILEDVLITIQKIKSDMELKIKFYEDGIGICNKDEICLWQPNKPLSEQSDETINFLYKLIK